MFGKLNYGLQVSGMGSLRGWLDRAASLRGWDAPPVVAATRRLAATQLCFERAAAPAVARLARNLAPSGPDQLRFVGRDYGCETTKAGITTCRLAAIMTNATDDTWPLVDATDMHVVLAGGREVPLVLERATVGVQVLDATQSMIPMHAAAIVRYRLEVPLREDRELARPVMLRDRYGRFHPMRPAPG